MALPVFKTGRFPHHCGKGGFDSHRLPPHLDLSPLREPFLHYSGNMSLKDKLEIGLKPDAPYRPDNLPEEQQGDADCVEAARPGTDAEVEEARRRCDDEAVPTPKRTLVPPGPRR